MNNPKSECETLMNEMLPLAEKLLSEFGEFYPYGGYIKPNGEVVHVGAREAGTEHPKATALVSTLRNSFQRLAANKQCKATAILYDVVVPISNENGESDAIQVCLDHIDNYSAEVFFPYILRDGGVNYGETFAQEGKHEIFGK